MSGSGGQEGKRSDLAWGGPAFLLILLALVGFWGLRPALESSRPAEGAGRPPPADPLGMHAVYGRLWQDPLELVQDAPREPVEMVISTGRGRPGKLLCMPVLLHGGPWDDDHENRMRIRYAVLTALGKSGYVPKDPGRMPYLQVRIDILLATAKEEVPIDVALPFRLFEWDNSFINDPASAGDRREPRFDDVLVLWVDQGRLGLRPLGSLSRILNKVFEKVDPAEKPGSVEVAVLGPTDSDTLLAMGDELLGEPPRFDPPFKPAVYSPRATIEPNALGEEQREALHVLSPSRSEAKGVRFVRTIGTDEQLAREVLRELQLRWPGSDAGRKNLVIVTELDTAYGRRMFRTFERVLAPPEADGGGGQATVHVFSYLRGIDGRLPEDSPDKDRSRQDKRQPDASMESAHGRSQFDYIRRGVAGIRELERALKRKGEGKIDAIGVLGTDVYDKLLMLRALRKDFPDVWFFTTDLEAPLAEPGERDFAHNLLVASHFGLQLRSDLMLAPPFRDVYQTSTYFSCLLILGSEPWGRWVRAPLEGGWRHEKGWKYEDWAADPWGLYRPGGGPGQARYALSPLVFEVGRSGPYQLTIPPEGPGKAVHPPSPREEWWRWFRAPAHWLWLLLGAGCLILCTTTYFLPRAAWFVAQLLWPPLLIVAVVLGLPVVFLLGLLMALIGLGGGEGDPGQDKTARDVVSRTLNAPRNLWRWVVATFRLTRWEIWLGEAVTAALIAVICWNHGAERGEPFALFEGISIWPGTLLRYGSAVLALTLTWKCYQDLAKNNERVIGRFFRPAAGEAAPPEAGSRHPAGARPHRKGPSPKDRRDGVAGSLQPGNLVPDFEHALSVPRGSGAYYRDLYGRYTALEEPRRSKLPRVLFCSVCYFLFGFALFQLVGMPLSPARGVSAQLADRLVTMAAVISMIVLLFTVLDSIILCSKFTRKLADGPREDGGPGPGWPAGGVDELGRGPGYPPAVAREVLTVTVIAERTKAVSWLIYYPFLIVLLMAVSRYSVFDNFGYPWPLVVLIGVSLGVTWLAAGFLRVAAENAREKVLFRLENGLARAVTDAGTPAKGPAPGKQATPADARPAEKDLYRQAIEEVKNQRDGAFRPWTQDPFIRAILIPFGGVGSIALVEQLFTFL